MVSYPDLSKGPKMVPYTAKLSTKSKFWYGLSKLDKKELIGLLMGFKDDVVEEIQNGEQLSFSSRNLLSKMRVLAR